MFRFLFLGLAFYLAARIVGGLFKPTDSGTTVKGKRKNAPLELSDDDVIDVDFKETKDE